MGEKRAWTPQKHPDISRLKEETRANVDDLERRVAAIEGKTSRLETLAAWVRGALYSAILVAFALIPSAPPSEPPK